MEETPVTDGGERARRELDRRGGRASATGGDRKRKEEDGPDAAGPRGRERNESWQVGPGWKRKGRGARGRERRADRWGQGGSERRGERMLGPDGGKGNGPKARLRPREEIKCFFFLLNQIKSK